MEEEPFTGNENLLNASEGSSCCREERNTSNKGFISHSRAVLHSRKKPDHCRRVLLSSEVTIMNESILGRRRPYVLAITILAASDRRHISTKAMNLGASTLP